MKKLMLLMLALAACVWGEVFVKDSIHIVFPQNIANYLGADDEKCFFGRLPNGKVARIFTNGYGTCYGDVCSSVLDTSVFFLEEDEISDQGFNDYFFYKGVDSSANSMIYSFYALSDATHSLMEVICDEFKRFQECGYFDVSSEVIDSILSDMDSVVESSKYHWDAYLTDCGNGAGCMDDCPLVGGPCFWSGRTSLSEILKKRNSQASIPYRMDFAARVAVENGRLRVPASLESRAYMLYGLNGRVLRSGQLRNNMALPREPSVLRVKGFGDVYLK